MASVTWKFLIACHFSNSFGKIFSRINVYTIKVNQRC